MNHDVFCAQCGLTGSVGRVTAALRCPGCGSDDLGLVGFDPVPAHLATKKVSPKGKRHEEDADEVKSETGSSGPKARKGDKPWDIDEDKAKKRKESAGRFDVQPNKQTCPHCGQVVVSTTPQSREFRDHVASHERTSAAANPKPTSGSGGSGWNQRMPDALQGWSDYAGPTPPGTVLNAENGPTHVADDNVCPACKGSGYDVQDKTVCRECGGFGRISHPTEPEGLPNVARHPGQTARPQVGPVTGPGSPTYAPKPYQPFTYASSMSPAFQAHLSASGNSNIQITGGRPSANPLDTAEYYLQHYSPDYKHRNRTVEDANKPHGWRQEDQDTYFPRAENRSSAVPYRETPSHGYAHGQEAHPMPGAWCPMCGHDETHLERDSKDDAWWTCPNCGPLANIDKHPEVNPYDTDDDFEPNRNMKRASRWRRASKKTGRIFRIIASVQQNNQLSDREAFELARRTVASYPEQ